MSPTPDEDLRVRRVSTTARQGKRNDCAGYNGQIVSTGQNGRNGRKPHPIAELRLRLRSPHLQCGHAPFRRATCGTEYDCCEIFRFGKALSMRLLADKQGYLLALLEVRASNIAAQTLYAQLNFTEVGRRKGYYVPEHKGADREDAILMQLTLNTP